MERNLVDGRKEEDVGALEILADLTDMAKDSTEALRREIMEANL
jgi:hypothetical protein